MTTREIYQTLLSSLPGSMAVNRSQWARIIVEQDLDLLELSRLLLEDKKVATRFLWLLSDVGALQPQKLAALLPHLFEIREQVKADMTHAFTRYWFLCGIPPENEGEAVDMLFDWFLSPKTGVSIKVYAMGDLVQLAEKYPDLKEEVKLAIETMLGNSTDAFDRCARKYLKRLEGEKMRR
ncbi:MAG: hypothetical protein WA004_05525 [Saprospiraceae bacterium]